MGSNVTHRAELPRSRRRTVAGRFAAAWARRAAALAAAVLLALGFAAPAPAQTPVDLQLVLAVDVSGSVNQTRFELQRDGYVAAFRNPRVLEAIRSGVHQSIAVTMVQWTGPALQVLVVPWMRIGDAASAEALAAAIEGAPRQLFGGGTSISGAIDYGVALMGDSSYVGRRRVIDVSGDGANNRGRLANLARDDAIAAGVTINGLPILALEPDLDTYYQNSVIGGPGAFMVVAERYETFAAAILKKLITEIASGEGALDLAVIASEAKQSRAASRGLAGLLRRPAGSSQ